ncbi:MAG: hypothetical protein QOH03_861 [Kribbellaceae bacterium]|nr:hypothetical protein [Kribbellaceae bacterium]
MERDDEAVQRYAEQFGNVLAEMGWPRMSARAFAAVLVSEDGRLTAAELSELLKASPAAISGAVNYLLQLRLVTREREPGSRRDVYVVQDDFWFQSMVSQDRGLSRWEDILRQMLPVTGTATQANRRIRASIGFIEFIQEEVEALTARWVIRKAEIDAKIAADDGR